MILGIDVGGTSVKFGIVSPEGEISQSIRYGTEEWVKNGGFVKNLIKEVGVFLETHPSIKGVGLGFPGLLSADRKEVVLLANIPSVNNVPIVQHLKSEYPKIVFKIENDAKCATLGEYYFGENRGMDNYMLITLGTGVGSGAMINKRLFIGAKGNGMEIGHMLMDDGKTLEDYIKLSNIVKYAQKLIDEKKFPTTIKRDEEITPKVLHDAACAGDKLAIEVFNYVGHYLGMNVVSVMRVIDLDNILLGGGISGAFEFIVPSMKAYIEKSLPPYYTAEMTIKKASLSNDAGLLGAAGLIMEDYHVLGDVLD
jgi:glucokinase